MTQSSSIRRAARRICLVAALLLFLAGCAAGEPAAPPAPEETPAPLPTASPAPEFVPLDGRVWPADAASLLLGAGTSADELLETLPLFPALETVRFYGGAVPWDVQDALRAAFPGVEFLWSTELLGQTFPWAATAVSFAGQPLTEDDLLVLEENVFRLPNLRSVDLTGCGFSDERMDALNEALGGPRVIWSFPLYGAEVSSGAVELDLADRRVADGGAALEAALPRFFRLEKADLSRCGMSNEALDALNRRLGDVRVVWTVYIAGFAVRTDETNFIAARTYNRTPVYSFQCGVLRYCTDMIALDLGHKELTDLSFLYDMPQLQYLILVENPIRDVTPIGSLKELKYLEIFWTKVEDLSPLINCTALEDLNICYIYSRPEPAFEVLMQMPWLERLWYCGSALSEEQIAALRANMPGCEMYLAPHGESTGSTWRYHEHYYTMRDVFGMYYMPGGTNGVAPDGSQIIIDG